MKFDKRAREHPSAWFAKPQGITEVDKPFQISRGFAIIWLCLGVVVGFLVFRQSRDPLYHKLIYTLLGSLYATFCLYGPILFARQVARSGRRGAFVLKVFLAIIASLALVWGSVTIFGEESVLSRISTFLFALFFLQYQWSGNERRS